MSKLKIYGIPGSRAIRSLWLAEELRAEIGFDYELVNTDFLEQSKTPEYLAINPNGKVPAIEDDGFVLFESLAINLYLVKKHKSSLSPRDLQEEARITQWSVWALTELEESLIVLVLRSSEVAFLPPDEEIENAAREKLKRPMAVLNDHLQDKSWLAAERFTLADQYVASVMTLMRYSGFDLSQYAVNTWLDSCLARPAYLAAQQV